jgi:hypothetical protein
MMTADDQSILTDVLDMYMEAITQASKLRGLTIKRLRAALQTQEANAPLEVEASEENPFTLMRLDKDGWPEARHTDGESWVSIAELSDLQIAQLGIETLKAQ